VYLSSDRTCMVKFTENYYMPCCMSHLDDHFRSHNQYLSWPLLLFCTVLHFCYRANYRRGCKGRVATTSSIHRSVHEWMNKWESEWMNEYILPWNASRQHVDYLWQTEYINHSHPAQHISSHVRLVKWEYDNDSGSFAIHNFTGSHNNLHWKRLLFGFMADFFRLVV